MIARRVAALALALGAGPACIELGPVRPAPVRYFHLAPRPGPPPSRAATDGPVLRLLAVRAAPHLSDRIVWRRADHEAGFHEDRRWLERPVVVFRRALARDLFEARGFRRSDAADAPRLAIELSRF